MTILELAANINKSSKNEDTDFIYSGILDNEFGIFDTIQSYQHERFKCYWLLKWYCTDSYVGKRMYFFDDVFVAISYKQGRKCQEEFTWVSKEYYNQVKNYLLSLIEYDENPDDILTEEDFKIEFGQGEKIDYVEQLLTNKIIYQGLVCNIIDKNRQNNTINLSEVGWVSIHNVIIPYELNTNKKME